MVQKFLLILTLCIVWISTPALHAQKKRNKKDDAPKEMPKTAALPAKDSIAPKPADKAGDKAADKKKTGPQPYAEVITAKASTMKGLFWVHKLEDKYYFEIPDSLLGRDIITVTRIAKTATGAGYGGEELNRQVIRFEKAPGDKILIRAVGFYNISPDSSKSIFQAVANSNVDPIVAAFEVKSYHDKTAAVIEVTDFFKDNSQIISLQPFFKQRYRIGELQKDKR
jgi:hypothetical protein